MSGDKEYTNWKNLTREAMLQKHFRLVSMMIDDRYKYRFSSLWRFFCDPKAYMSEFEKRKVPPQQAEADRMQLIHNLSRFDMQLNQEYMRFRYADGQMMSLDDILNGIVHLFVTFVGCTDGPDPATLRALYEIGEGQDYPRALMDLIGRFTGFNFDVRDAWGYTPLERALMVDVESDLFCKSDVVYSDKVAVLISVGARPPRPELLGRNDHSLSHRQVKIREMYRAANDALKHVKAYSAVSWIEGGLITCKNYKPEYSRVYRYPMLKRSGFEEGYDFEIQDWCDPPWIPEDDVAEEDAELTAAAERLGALFGSDDSDE